jgi:hypothetical protein
VLPRWPASKVNLPKVPEDATTPVAEVDERHIAMRIYRPGEEPLLVVGIYLKCGDPALATAQGERIRSQDGGVWRTKGHDGRLERHTRRGACHPLHCNRSNALVRRRRGARASPTREGGWCIDYAVATSTAIPCGEEAV